MIYSLVEVKRQRGLASVELAIIAAAFFLIVMGALEVSRLLFTWNTLDAVVQRAARLAAVCPRNHSAIAPVAMFGQVGATTGVIPDLTAENIQITYLDQDFGVAGNYVTTQYVQAQIVNYDIGLNIPFIQDTTINSPNFTAVLPAESLGFIPGTGARSCLGSTA